MKILSFLNTHPMPKPLNIQALVGTRSGKLTLVGQGNHIGKHRAVLCSCDCGKTTHIYLMHFRRGNTRSCGCLQKEVVAEKNRTHGKTKTRAYKRWSWMISRATGKTDRKLYFDRGIRVCERWLSFENFYDDMGECPEGLSLDRINNNGNYEPINCRWASNHVQSRNRRNNVWVEFQGKSMCLTDAARAAGLSPGCVIQRRIAGIKDLFAPSKNRTHIEKWTGKDPIAFLKERMKQLPDLDDPTFE